MTLGIPLVSLLIRGGSTVSIQCWYPKSLADPSIVAITRAKALLIIVGDPRVLSLDPLWRSFLNYIHLNGGWTGPSIHWDPRAPVDETGGYDAAVRTEAQSDMNEFARRMEDFTLAGIGDIDEAQDANVDRPWRDVE